MTTYRRSTSLTPEELFDEWLDDVYPVLQQTWIAGYLVGSDSIPYNQETSIRSWTETSRSRTFEDSRHHTMSPDDEPLNPIGETFELPDEEMPPGWRKIYHLRGEHPCRRAAFILTQAILEGANLQPTKVFRKVNGQAVKPEETPTCGFCGYVLVQPTSNRDLDWVPHVVRQKPQTLTFADEHTGPARHPQDAMHNLISEMDTFDSSEIRQESIHPASEEEEEALRQLGLDLQVYTQDIPDEESTSTK